MSDIQPCSQSTEVARPPDGWLDAMLLLDAVEAGIEIMGKDGSGEEWPVGDVFTPGLYTRMLRIPKHGLLTSRVHMREHPFEILMGVISVWTVETGWVLHRAPFAGVTKPFTRRLLFAHEETVWITHHVTDETDVDKIIAEITLGHTNMMLEGAK